MSREELLPGVVLERSEDALVIRSSDALQVLSSAVVGGGRRTARTILNLHVAKSYDCRHPERDLRAVARALGLPAPVVGLMTAVPMREARSLAGSDGDIEVRAVVTVGLDNASRAGDRAAVTAPEKEAAWPRGGGTAGRSPSPVPPVLGAALPRGRPSAGTINAIFLCGAPLHEAAALELVAVASEAKASALVEAGVRTAGGALATGTSTDAVVIAWPPRGGTRIRFAGTATSLGALVARLMRDALAPSLARRRA